MFYFGNRPQISDANYNDNLQVNPVHYNAMRGKPIYPPTFIDANISSLRSFPNTWLKTKEEWKYFRDDKQFRKKCLFDVNDAFQVHLRTVDSLTNRHLLDLEIKFPDEDQIYKTIGQKRHVKNQRNNIEEKSPGDKPYKAVEYSNEFFYKKNRDWRLEKYEPEQRMQETLSNDMINLLKKNAGSSSAVASLFETKAEFGYEPLPHVEKIEDINDVRNLDNFKRAAPLECAFKVLDVSDKTVKYRPKITR